MNKIYKVMYSKVKQCAVVVSEIAKSHSKTSQKCHKNKKLLLTGVVLTALSFGSMLPSLADNMPPTYTDTETGVTYTFDHSLGLTGVYYKHNSKKYALVTYSDDTYNKVKSYGVGTFEGTGNIEGIIQKYPSYSRIPSSVSGGSYNVASGDSSSVSGGEYNMASGRYSSVSGGVDNVASGDWSSVSGGWNNVASGSDSSVSGGEHNMASGEKSSVSGGWNNVASGLHSSVSGGEYNKASGSDSSVSGGMYNKASGGLSSVSGGWRNVASGSDSSVSGGEYNMASGDSSSVSGGENNVASGYSSSVSGGSYNMASEYASFASGGLRNMASGSRSSAIGGCLNTASGYESSAIGGLWNTASGVASSAIGGYLNKASGSQSSAIGGNNNISLGMASSTLGGANSVVLGSSVDSCNTGIAGGSTGSDASYALAAGSQSVVTVANGTAIGYQATTNKVGTIAFGHDSGDVSGYTVTWQRRTDKDSSGNIAHNADGTNNEYRMTPTITENTYSSAYYNRLVKVADGINDHDVVVMEQLKNASDVGNNIKVYKTDENGNVQFDENNKPIEDTSDAAKTAQNGSKDAWGQALGADPFTAGTATTVTNASTSDQLVTGKTLYNYDKPTGSQNYVKVNNTTGQNLSALDAQVKDNADAIQKNSESIQNITNNLNNNINKAAAGSNALAALHPLDYDPDDKADFAVGYGHYRNANAAAVGAFYHPNENTMVNVGVSLGNGDPGFNAGVSFKVGRGGAGREAMSKTEMAKVINSQSKEIDALKKDNADKDKRIDALEQKMAEILAKLDKNGK